MTEEEIKQAGIKYADECGAKPSSTEHWNITMGFIAGTKLILSQLTEKNEQIEPLQHSLLDVTSKLVELNAQLEKMKEYCSCEYCCHLDEEYVTEEGKTICDLCNDKRDKWELKE